MSDAVPYEHLTPDVIVGAVESYGFETTGSILGLASYENRVYQIGVEQGFVVVKFYRPGRWTTDAILEEHEFALELAAQDIPVVPPIVHDGESLHVQDGEQWKFVRLHREGDPVDEIVSAADGVRADLIVMPTEGRHGVFAALRGSTTERVLRRVRCPLLAVPAGRA